MTLLRPRFVRSALPALALAAAAIPAEGCVLGSSSSDETFNGIPDPHSDDVVEDSPLAGCAEGLSEQEIADTVEITFDFEVSAHEMIACGGLVFGIVGALVEGLVKMAEDPDRSVLPEEYTYDGEGTYYVQPATFRDLRMEVRFYAGRDYAFAAQGELVTQNMFLLSSYLASPSAEVMIDTSGGGIPEVRIEITHAGPGPLVELLGLGLEPPNPIVVTQSVLDGAQGHLRDLGVESIIFFSDHPGVSTIEYDVQSPRMLADAFLEGSPMDLAMVGADGWRDDTGQDLDVDVWTVEYSDGVGALDGDIEFTTRGGRFDYVSKLHYDGTGWPVIELECAR